MVAERVCVLIFFVELVGAVADVIFLRFFCFFFCFVFGIPIIVDGLLLDICCAELYGGRIARMYYGLWCFVSKLEMTCNWCVENANTRVLYCGVWSLCGFESSSSLAIGEKKSLERRLNKHQGCNQGAKRKQEITTLLEWATRYISGAYFHVFVEFMFCIYSGFFFDFGFVLNFLLYCDFCCFVFSVFLVNWYKPVVDYSDSILTRKGCANSWNTIAHFRDISSKFCT